MSFFISSEDGYFALTTPGYTALAIIVLIALLLTAFVAGRKQNTGKIRAKQLAFSGIALALAFITSYIKYEMPMGGSVTLFSMFFICKYPYYISNLSICKMILYGLCQFFRRILIMGPNYYEIGVL